ncbi:hypothetical protein [Citricoccus sp.]|uniref:hypothetical protein n=1 Tax=Citricoccus sp. TaxID=1978372 RepID=UPI0028BD6A4F|nr:hypothetical protein [Citricoccus sp.]
MYSIHSGSLGITAELVRKNLEEISVQVKRWDAELLLDEADAFVLERSNGTVGFASYPISLPAQRAEAG